MTTRVARLSADLTASSAGFESSLARANRAMNNSQKQWNSALNRANRQFSAFDSSVRQSAASVFDLRNQLGGLAATAAGALSVQRLVQYSDTWKQLEGRLKIVSTGMDEVIQTQEALFDVAQRTRQPLEGITSFYTRLKQFVPEAERAQYDFLGVTESVASALAITGETGASASAAMIQFTQAIGTNFEAAGQEIRSLQEQAPRLAQALANALGDGTKSLKQLQEEGALTRQSVLNALGSLSDEARVLAGELENIPLTVGQALTRLDNAFLRYIGQADAVRAGTGSLALAITALADNLDLLAGALIAVAGVFAARLVPVILASATAMTVAAARSATLTYTLGTLAFSTKAAAVGFVTLSGAAGAMAKVLGLLGGPVGLAVLTTLAVMAKYTNAAKDAQIALNQAVGNHKMAVMEFITADKQRRDEIINNTQDRIEAYKAELAALESAIAVYEKRNIVFKKAKELGSFLGIDTDGDDARELADNLRVAIGEMEKDFVRLQAIRDEKPADAGGFGIDPKEYEKQQKQIQDVINGLKQESQQLDLQADLYGEKESAIKRAQAALRIQNQLEAQGITLTKEQSAAVEDYLDKIERQTELQDEQAKQQELLQEKERDRQQALNQLGATFESAFERAITDGEKLSDVLQGLLDDIVRILTRITITEPIGNAVADFARGSLGGGGFLSGIGDFFGDVLGFGSFATGIQNVPYDMTARIHKGETIIPAQQSKNMMMGGAVNITIENNNPDNNITQNARQTANGTELTIMIDKMVADNISRAGSKTNQAIKGLQDRTLVRR